MSEFATSYTNEEYQEDKRLVNFVINSYFKKYPEVRDELEQVGLMGIQRRIKEYDESRGMNRVSYKIMLCKSQMIVFVRKYYHLLRKKHDMNTTRISIYKTINAEESTTFGDMLPAEEVDFESNINCEYILKVCYNLLEEMKTYTAQGSLKNPNFYKVIPLYLKYFNIMKVAEEIGYSKQFVSLCVIKFRKALKEKLKEVGYFA